MYKCFIRANIGDIHYLHNDMDMRLNETDVHCQALEHLGLVASVIQSTGLIGRIDARIPVSKAKGAKLTVGQRITAMILNGLGFTNDRLYMFPSFLEDKPVSRLFGEDVEATDFNDDSLGRALDYIYEYGATHLFSELAFDIGQQEGLLGASAHFDTTSLSLYGEYEPEVIIDDTKPQSNHFPTLTLLVFLSFLTSFYLIVVMS